MKMEIVLSIVGFFGVMALGINGFFLRGIFSEMNSLKVELAKISLGGDHREKRIYDLEKIGRDHDFRLHKIEGATNQMLSYIKEKDD